MKRLPKKAKELLIRCVAHYASFEEASRMLEEEFGRTIDASTYSYYRSVQYEGGKARAKWGELFILERKRWAQQMMAHPHATPQGLFNTTNRIVKKAEQEGQFTAALLGVKILREMVEDNPLLREAISANMPWLTEEGEAGEAAELWLAQVGLSDEELGQLIDKLVQRQQAGLDRMLREAGREALPAGQQTIDVKPE